MTLRSLAMTVRSLADSAHGLSSIRAAKSRGEKLRLAPLLVSRGLLLFTAVTGVLLSQPEVPLFSFRCALATSLIGAVLALVRIASPNTATAIGLRMFVAAVLLVSGAMYLFLFTHPPSSSLVLAGLSGGFLLGGIAAQAGADISMARRREQQAKA
jgi:hypothetical protein